MIRLTNLVLALLCTISTHLFAQTTEVIQIVAGKAKIEGKINSVSPITPNSMFVEFMILHPISGDILKRTAHMNNDGTFNIDLDIETDYSIVLFNTNLNGQRKFLGKIRNGKTTIINIELNEHKFISDVHITESFKQNEFTEAEELVMEMFEFMPNRPRTTYYNIPFTDYLAYVKYSYEERIALLDTEPIWAPEIKNQVEMEFKLSFYNANAFQYKMSVMSNYYNIFEVDMDEADVQKIDNSYFNFLKDFNLNDPKNLTYFSFVQFQNSILTNTDLNIPELLDQDIPSWIAQVKSVLSNAVGFDNGEYYDVLAANAYGIQLVEQNKPLTEQQLKNISNYWKGGEIEKILRRKNEKLFPSN